MEVCLFRRVSMGYVAGTTPPVPKYLKRAADGVSNDVGSVDAGEAVAAGSCLSRQKDREQGVQCQGRRHAVESINPRKVMYRRCTPKWRLFPNGGGGAVCN